MELNTNNLQILDNIAIESDTVRLRELRGSDCKRIAEIARAYSVEATALLFCLEYLKNAEQFKADIEQYDEPLKERLAMFKMIKSHKDYRYIDRTASGFRDQFKEVINEIKEHFQDGNLFSPYGPIRAPFEENARTYADEAISARKNQRKLFRMGIEYEENFAGCFVFDFLDHSVDTRRATGDIGIFIDPEFREIKGKGRCWRDTFFVAATFMQAIFPFCGDGYTHICATTHPLNLQTRGILTPEYGFDAPLLRDTEWGKRNYFAIEKNKFFETFLEKQRTAENGVKATWVKAGAVFLDTAQEVG